MPKFDEHYTCDDLIAAADRLSKLPFMKNTPRIMAREELLHGWGHGWEEIWFIGDDEDPEEITLVECVWIDGMIATADGADGCADSDHWKERYGKKYAMRIWGGNTIPTDEQRRETPWRE